MKPTAIRALCAVLLMLIAMGILAGVILATPEREELSAWTKVTFQTGGRGELYLYNVEGELLKTLVADGEGSCTTDLMEEGSYYGVCSRGLVEFALTEQGILEAKGAALAVDRYTLSFSHTQQPGQLRILGHARQEWYIYELYSPAYSTREVLHCTVGKEILCTISDIPYGEYTLSENGRILCSVEISAEEPAVEVSLP